MFAIGEGRGEKLNIPIKHHKQSNKWQKSGRLMSGFSLGEKYITIRYELKDKEKIKKTEGLILGADQGMKDVLTFSNETTTPKVDRHGHTLESILINLSRKKKGSRAFERGQKHRKDFINWSINQLDLNSVKEIRVEEIKNINFGKAASRKMQAWTNTIIRDKLQRRCDEEEVLLVHQSSVYMSQRCCECGMVRKSNRKGKTYTCNNCNNVCDADLNAAKNHELGLIPFPFELRFQKLNLKNGFFWKPEGFFNFEGREFSVPSHQNKV